LEVVYIDRGVAFQRFIRSWYLCSVRFSSAFSSQYGDGLGSPITIGGGTCALANP
ncbi:hypothetical protein L9F63_024150, partial [Diploptera punctata]